MFKNKFLTKSLDLIDFSGEKEENGKNKVLMIDFRKATINTAKLVQKRVPVKGKDGKIFYRMQWVNPNDEEGQNSKGTNQENTPQNSLGNDNQDISQNSKEGENSLSSEVKAQMRETFLNKDTDGKYEEYSKQADEETKSEIESQAKEILYIDNTDSDFEDSMELTPATDEEDEFVLGSNLDNMNQASLLENVFTPTDEFAQSLYEDNSFMRAWEQDYSEMESNYTDYFIPEGDIPSIMLDYGIGEDLLPSLRWLSKRKKPDYEDNPRNLRFSKLDYTMNTLYVAFASNILGLTKDVRKVSDNVDGIRLTDTYDKDSKNDDEYVGYVRNRCIQEQLENTEYTSYVTKSQLYTILGSHPGVLRFALDSIWGKDWHRQLKSDLANSSLCITVDSKNTNSILDNGYKASTPEEYLVNTCRKHNVEEKYIEQAKEALKETCKTDSLGDFTNVFVYKLKNEMGDRMPYAEYDITDGLKSRYLAEKNSSGIKMDDPKPSYLFFNPTGSEILEYYGNSNIEVDQSILKNCTICMDDSFNESGTVPMARSMDNLKELYVLRGTINNGTDIIHSIRDDDYEWAKFTNYGYNIPLELQYHTHDSSIDKSLLSDTDY